LTYSRQSLILTPLILIGLNARLRPMEINMSSVRDDALQGPTRQVFLKNGITVGAVANEFASEFPSANNNATRIIPDCEPTYERSIRGTPGQGSRTRKRA